MHFMRKDEALKLLARERRRHTASDAASASADAYADADADAECASLPHLNLLHPPTKTAAIDKAIRARLQAARGVSATLRLRIESETRAATALQAVYRGNVTRAITARLLFEAQHPGLVF